MSVYYTVKETLNVTEAAEENEMFQTLVHAHLTWLGWKLLQDRANVYQLSLSVGDQKFTFSGKTITSDFHELIRALKSASSFHLAMDYCYVWYGADPETACDHLSISSYLEETEESERKGIFYTMYNYADCGDDVGVLCAYGEKNGKVYNGVVQEQEISEFPSTGSWCTPKECVVCCPDELDGLNMDSILKVIDELSALSEGDNLTVSENELAYYMNQFEPKNADDFKKFVRLAGELLELTEGQCCFCAELVDWDDPYNRILKIDIEDREKYSITMAAID